MTDKRVIISGGGIAGLALGILLKEKGWEPEIIERYPALRTEGYMMDFYGTGWDVAERMCLLNEIRKIHYPIDYLEFVDRNGNPHFPAVPIDRVRDVLKGRYAYLRRPDLERILFNRALSSGVEIRFGKTIKSIEETNDHLNVKFDDDTTESSQLLFGADGVHSHVRELIFGEEAQFDRFLGYYVAAFHLSDHEFDVDRAMKIYEEPDRVAWFYPLNDRTMDATFIFRHDDVGRLPHEKRLPFVREQFAGAGWITEDVLRRISPTEAIYFDSMTQIVMQNWHKGRIALLGDACGCLTPIAGQGSHMAMAGAYVIADELERHFGDHESAFSAYQHYLKPFVEEKQNEAVGFAGQLIPSSRTKMMFRYPLIRLVLTKFFLNRFLNSMGAKSVLDGYRTK